MLTSILASAHHEIDLSVLELRAPVCLYVGNSISKLQIQVTPYVF